MRVRLEESTLKSVNVGRPSFEWKDPRNPSSGTRPLRLDEWQDSYELPVDPDRIVSVWVVRHGMDMPCPRQRPKGPTMGGVYCHRIEGTRLVLPVAIPDDAHVELEVA